MSDYAARKADALMLQADSWELQTKRTTRSELRTFIYEVMKDQRHASAKAVLLVDCDPPLTNEQLNTVHAAVMQAEVE